MSKRHLFIGLAVGGSVTALTIVAFYEPTRIVRGIVLREAFFRGRPTSYWRQVIGADGRAERIQAETVNQFDDLNAVPVLRECLRDPDPAVRWASLVLIQRAGSIQDVEPALKDALEDADLNVQIAGMRGLARLRREALSAVPRLQELARAQDLDVRSNAHHALWEIDQDRALLAGEWKEFTSDDWEFTATMPGQPEGDITWLDTLYGPAPCHQFVVPFGAAHCIVAVTEYDPQVALEAPIEEPYDTTIEGLADALGGTLIQDERVEQSGYAGRETVVEVKGKATLHTRLFLVGDRSYQINITYPPGFVSPKAVAYYFDSLRIDYLPSEGN